MLFSFDLVHFWRNSDAVSHSVALLLLVMSVLTWYIIVRKLWQYRNIRNSHHAVDAFWQSTSANNALTALKQQDTACIYWPLASCSVSLIQQQSSNIKLTHLLQQQPVKEQANHLIRTELQSIQQHLHTGQTALASIGSTAPFIGLFGTVWGIYHALTAISVSGTQIAIQSITAPVGEALIMTACGLFVAIPAVLAYNSFQRINHLTTTLLEGFAYDLHAYVLSVLKKKET